MSPFPRERPSGLPGVQRRWLAIGACLCAILVLPVAWNASQGWVFPDGTSYFDMASSAVHDSPSVLLKNAYWSPGYPAVLALMMVVVRPSATTEWRAISTVHWLLFVAATACFSLLLWTFLQWLRRNSWPELARDGVLFKGLVFFAYAFFLLSNINRTLWYATPDMLLQSLVYLSAACGFRLFLPGSSWRRSAALGLVIGLGYLAKAAMFPSALLLLGILFIRPPKDALGRWHSVIALACFCLVASPLVLSLSHEKHRFTFGDSGRLNYIWFVGGVPPYGGWVGQNPENGIPAHAPRKVSGAPLILEFRSPVGGTLPIWYDPSYWWEGIRAPISLRRHLAPLFWLFEHPHSRQTLFLALVAALAPLCLFDSRVRKAIRKGGIQVSIFLLWPTAACLMYMLVNFSYRYTAVYLVMFCLGAASTVLQPFPCATRARVLFAAGLLLAVATSVSLQPLVKAALRAPSAGSVVLDDHGDTGPVSAVIAQGLTRLGIRPGDEISVLGRSLESYYARLAEVRIVAQIWEDPDQIVGLSAPEVRRVLTQLKQLGVKALLSRVKPGFVNDVGWIAIPQTDVYVRLL